MDHRKIMAGGFFLLLFLTGCNNTAVFDYNAALGTMGVFREKGTAQKTVAVMPFLDQRAVNQPGVVPLDDTNCFFWGFCPLVYAGFTEKEEPEKSDRFVTLRRFHFDPPNDLANAAFLSLENSNLFKKVTKACDRAQASGADYIWRGKIMGTGYSGKIYSYLITYFLSPALWIIGFPSGSSTCRLGVAFELVRSTDGKVVWSYNYSGEDYIFHWIYSRIGQDTSLYPRLMKQAMNAALSNLAEKMPAL
ncbi:MAG: hypothetical protein IKC65_01590 [Lentisphaeria bacterium]|nr:hypothetical protein [Lentisphaeria bacterium]